MKKQLLGMGHPEWALTANNLAMALLDEGKIAPAVTLLKQAARTVQQKLAQSHPLRLRIEENLATALAA